jgi:hypothetical protein
MAAQQELIFLPPFIIHHLFLNFMKQLLTLFFSAFSIWLFSQNDTTVYTVVDEMPRFPGCEEKDTTLEAKIKCAQTNLLVFFNSNIVYPLEARQQNLEGTVVLSLVVEKDGYISNPVVKKDIGGGTGDEAMRVALGMNEALKQAKLTWTPGKKGGKAVRSLVTVPIKFKLQDPPDFVIVNRRDTVFVVLDDSLGYKEGNDALGKYFTEKLTYPEEYKDTCLIGDMDMTLLVRPDGAVKVLDLSDYWNLGWDFQFQAIKTAVSTWGKWKPATRKGKDVPASIDLSVSFRPDAAQCAQRIAQYQTANQLANEGSSLFNEGKQAEGIQKLNEALQLFPNNANFLYLRGQAYMKMEKMDEACADFRKVQSMTYIDVVNQLIPIICK